jgi:hypothetical protein
MRNRRARCELLERPRGTHMINSKHPDHAAAQTDSSLSRASLLMQINQPHPER